MSGSNVANQFGDYGTKGTATAGNVPGARTNSVTWTDAAGNLWLFGGEGNDINGLACALGNTPCVLNDLWKYSNGEWAWMGGSKVANQPGNYGTQGVAATGNVPGGRWGSVAWMDSSGNVWLYGGYGFDSSHAPGVYGDLNDLWKYSNGEWTWVNGSDQAGELGTYGTQGVAASSNVPGARDSAVGWIDRSGNLWLFSGQDALSIPYGGKFNDLWEYQP